MKASMMAPGAVESQAGGVPVTKAVLRAVSMSGAFPAGKAFSEAGPRDTGQKPPPPGTALAPLLFFPIVEDKHFLLTALLWAARELRMDRAGWGAPSQAG